MELDDYTYDMVGKRVYVDVNLAITIKLTNKRGIDYLFDKKTGKWAFRLLKEDRNNPRKIIPSNYRTPYAYETKEEAQKYAGKFLEEAGGMDTI